VAGGGRGKYIITTGGLNDITKVYKDGEPVDPKSYSIGFDEDGRTVINFKRRWRYWRPWKH